ncbi:hypothetical protein MA16_Dca021650 [Dendrobium catenatum]|uniref:Uncharacterized protein n=1 Tax=Dendrobium catenatum TaxID=906689 RepID=A0A2I0W1I1_9ASPA|nr:hypothetical protein MA16_Dca021650 [Dendrobium catenatum]
MMNMLIWIIPLSLVLTSCRRLVFLVSILQEMYRSLTETQLMAPTIWNLLAEAQFQEIHTYII